MSVRVLLARRRRGGTSCSCNCFAIADKWTSLQILARSNDPDALKYCDDRDHPSLARRANGHGPSRGRATYSRRQNRRRKSRHPHRKPGPVRNTAAAAARS